MQIGDPVKQSSASLACLGSLIAPSRGTPRTSPRASGRAPGILPGGVGHYVFLDSPTPKAKKELPLLAVDLPGVDRAAIHERVAGMAVEFFAEALKQ